MDKLLSFYPPLDVVDPEAFTTALITLFAHYPAEVMTAATDPVQGIAPRCKYLRLAEVREVLDEIAAPIMRQIAREIEAEHRRRTLPPTREKRTAEEQARIDEQVGAWRKENGLPVGGLK
ncbi:MAG: hypothetical protein ACXWML_09820 [Candidatus Binataceae bacterium]